MSLRSVLVPLLSFLTLVHRYYSNSLRERLRIVSMWQSQLWRRAWSSPIMRGVQSPSLALEGKVGLFIIGYHFYPAPWKDITSPCDVIMHSSDIAMFDTMPWQQERCTQQNSVPLGIAQASRTKGSQRFGGILGLVPHFSDSTPHAPFGAETHCSPCSSEDLPPTWTHRSNA